MKKQNPRTSFPEDDVSSQYNGKGLQGSSLSQGFYFLSQGAKLQPRVQLPAAPLPPQDAAVYFVIERRSQKLSSIWGYPHCRFLLCPLSASMANPFVNCGQAHFHSWAFKNVLWYKVGIDDADGHSGGERMAQEQQRCRAHMQQIIWLQNGATHFLFSHLMWAQTNELASMAMFSLLISHEKR